MVTMVGAAQPRRLNLNRMPLDTNPVTNQTRANIPSPLYPLMLLKRWRLVLVLVSTGTMTTLMADILLRVTSTTPPEITLPTDIRSWTIAMMIVMTDMMLVVF